LQIVLEEHKGVEGVGVLKRRRAGRRATKEGGEFIHEISGATGARARWGAEKKGKAAGGEGRRVGGEGEEGIRGRVRVRGFHLFEEATIANRATEIGGR
jgi:hypothetical protein